MNAGAEVRSVNELKEFWAVPLDQRVDLLVRDKGKGAVGSGQEGAKNFGVSHGIPLGLGPPPAPTLLPSLAAP